MMRELCRYHLLCRTVLALVLSATGCDNRLQHTDAPARDKGREAARAEDDRSRAEAPRTEDGPLQLRISAPKTSIVQCEPVPLKFELKNVSEKTVMVDLAFNPIYGNLLVEITPPGEEPYLVEPPGIVSYSGAPREINARQSVTHGQPLHYNWKRGFHFKRPGQYRVEATFRDLESNALVLTVLQAQGDDAKALEEHWGCNPVDHSVYGGGYHLIDREFEAILKKYPTCVYAPWCELALARSARSRARQDRQMRKKFSAEVPPDLAEIAIRDYERFLKKHPDFPFPFPVQMRYEIAKMKMWLGRKEEALREIEELFEKHPEVDFVKEAKFKIDLFAELGREITVGQLP